ncbi:MAG TPA: XRE family transcriptional regulator [Candidatus Hydrogenedentes bacterium]|mgnify:FL=1|nr:XRE family transcriptional regulator [Candidatus Hydrogenedentota bacterium]HPC17343.1 XRE family transcriptional regulator [Candidatus Hydrogenedentota bacterium]HRT20077.1 XRE family transcriptional regulator [Candidatus Hydrogenedentota bacterium]HRT64859.1 XRE family transcriptional regulator [Candidatus Hydrogenedentota bacterium]
MQDKTSLGHTIRTLREARHLSVEQLAEKSQLNRKLLEELEADEHVASLAPIIKIARGLGVPLSALIDDAPTAAPVVVRGGRSETSMEMSGLGPYCLSTLDFHPLAKNKRDRHMEPFVVEVHPTVPEECTLSFHDGEEFLYVLSGRIEVIHGGQRYELAPGDSIYYDSSTPHQVQAIGDTDARILAVVYA